jgi:allantoinase
VTRVAPETNEHRHKLTPYEGMELKGAVVATYLRGVKIYERGEFAAEPTGTLLLREPPPREPSPWVDHDDF